MRVLTCGFLVVDIVAAGLERIAGPGELVYTPRGITVAVGGHPANVAVDLVKLGLEPELIGVCGAVGEDIFGDFIVRTLAGYGLKLFIDRVPLPTNKNIILVVKGEDRRFHVEVGASRLLDPVSVTRLIEQLKPQVFYLASGITDGVDEKVGDVFGAAKVAGSLTFADLVPPYGKDWSYIKPALPFIDVFHCNESEALSLTGARDLKGAVGSLLSSGIKLVLVTLGEKGAVAATQRLLLRQPACRVEVVDPTGAGDAFCAGFIYKLLECGLQAEGLSELGAEELAEMLLWAQATGATACTAPGTTEGVERSKVEAIAREQGNSLLSRTIVEAGGWR